MVEANRQSSISINSSGDALVVWARTSPGSVRATGRFVAWLSGPTGSEFISDATGPTGSKPQGAYADSGDFLAVVGSASGVQLARWNGVVATYLVGDGEDDATITLRATIEDLNIALDGLAYTPAPGFNGIATLTITADDLGSTGSPGPLQDVDNVQITVGNPNAPVMNLDGDDSSGAGGNNFAASWTEGGGTVLIADTDATLIDTDENLTGMTVTITNQLDGTNEVLAADTTGTSIVASYDSATGILTLSGSDTAANYQQVLRTIAYDNASLNPDPTSRVITFTPIDALSNGNTATTSLTIAPVNDAPINSVPGDQSTPQDVELVFDAAGSNLVSIGDADTGDADVSVSLSVSNGTLSLTPATPVGTSSTINQTTVGDQTEPAIGYAADGSSVVVFRSRDALLDQDAIIARQIDADGNPIGSDILVRAPAPDFAGDPQIAVAPSGEFVVTWQSVDVGGLGGVFARRYDASGNPLDVEWVVNSTTSGGQGGPDIAMLSTGEFIIVWDGNGAGDDAGIFYQRYAADGTPVGGETLVNVQTNGTHSMPSVDFDASGNFVITWSRSATGGPNIVARQFTAAGVGGPVISVGGIAGSDWHSEVAVMDDGSFVVVWDNASFDDNRGVYARRFDASGTSLGSQWKVQEPVIGDTDISADSAGNFVITWAGGFQRYMADGSQFGEAVTVPTTTGMIARYDPQGDLGVVYGVTDADGTGLAFQRYLAPLLDVTVGDGANDASMTFTGTLADIHLVLDGMTYTPNAGYNGFDTLTITTDDLGNSGSGGALQDVDNVQITVGNPNEPVLDLDADDSSGAGGSDYATSWTEGAGPVSIADSDATLNDTDENLTGLDVTITNLLDGTDEVLAASTSGTSIVANYDSATGVLTLTGADTGRELRAGSPNDHVRQRRRSARTQPAHDHLHAHRRDFER